MNKLNLPFSQGVFTLSFVSCPQMFLISQKKLPALLSKEQSAFCAFSGSRYRAIEA